MKLISNFKDYYDGILYSMTEPNNKIWIRNKENNYKFLSYNVNKIKHRLKIYKYNSNNLYDVYILNVIVICGEIYPYISVYNNIKSYDIQYCSRHKLDNSIFDKNEINKIFSDYFYKKNYNNIYDIVINYIKPIFLKTKEYELSMGNLPVIIDYLLVKNIDYNKNDGVYYKLNKNLLNIKFNKFMDDYTLFKQLEIYINEQLNTEIYQDNMTDDEKIQSHGFDKIISFRKRK